MASSGSIRTTDIHNNEKTSEENAQGSDYEELNASIGLKRKASTSLNEAKRKRPIEDQVLKERGPDPEDPKEKIKSLMFHVDALKAECMWKDNQIEKLKIELVEKAEEIKKLLATNSRYKSGLACIICTGYLANPCTVNCGHSFCYSCLREWLKTNKENGSKCPSCRTEIITQPVLSYALKSQVEALVEQLSPEEKLGVLETLEKEDQMYKQISDHWAGIFDQSIRPLHDEEDGVLRCPTCSWEVEGSICGNCGQRINIENRVDNSDDNNDSNDDDSEIDNRKEPDTYDSNDSFIDDGSEVSNLMGNNELHEDSPSPAVTPDNPTNDNDPGDEPYEYEIVGEQASADESYVIGDNEDEPPSPHVNMNRPFNTILINDSSSELSEEQSECDRIEGNNNVIVISSDENGEEKSLHSFHSNGSQLTSPLSVSSYGENHEVENYGVINPSSCESDEGSCRVGLNTRLSLDQDGESQVRTKSFADMSSEVEYTEHDSDEDCSYHLYLY